MKKFDIDIDNSKFISPFGPKILVSQCSEEIVNCLNDYTEKVCKDENLRNNYSSFGNTKIPNLLKRNLENIFLSDELCKNFGIVNYLEKIGNLYLQQIQGTYFNFEPKSKLNKINFDQTEFNDCWINRYFGSDFTPLHMHYGHLSGILFLKIPNNNSDCCTELHKQGKVSFIYGGENTFCDDLWFPDQKVGTILIFPSWLRHVVYPTSNNQERRTLSFNLIVESFEKKKINVLKYF